MRRKYEDVRDRNADARRSRKMKMFRNEVKNRERNRCDGQTRKVIEYSPHMSVLKVSGRCIMSGTTAISVWRFVETHI